MRILVVHGDQCYRFLNVESTPRDGSLCITIRREMGAGIGYSWSNRPASETPIERELPTDRAGYAITVHQSGRVNFHENRQGIYIEPLTAITKPSFIYRYRIPCFSRLTPFNDEPDPEDFILDTTAIPDAAFSFSFYICPETFLLTIPAIKFTYLGTYALVIGFDSPAYVPPPELTEHFITLKPEQGTVPAQMITEEQAYINYHQLLHNKNDVIIYGPNGEGTWQLVFGVPMRIAPEVRIELDDPALLIEIEPRDQRVPTAMVRFKVRNRLTREVIRTLVSFRAIELDARIGGS